MVLSISFISLSALYQWTQTLETHSALKQAIDSALCAFCCAKPSFFQLLLQKVQILVPNLSSDHTDSISDDRKESEGQTDDRKSGTDSSEWYSRLAQSEYKKLRLTEGQLLSVAAAARSVPGVCQLINSGLPTLLTACITEFSILEKAKQQRIAVNEEHQGASSSASGLTDNDKASEGSNHANGLNMTEPESITVVLEFLSLLCSEGRMRDWLGKEGSGFWLPLLTYLSNRPIENPSMSSPK